MNTKLYVGNLSYSVDDSGLRGAFAPHGNVVSATVVTDRDTGQSRGFGFVEYSSSREAQLAVDAMNGVSLDGRSLNVNVARPREGSRDSSGGGATTRAAGRSKGW